MRHKKVFAHFCTWFKTRDFSGEWAMWSSDYAASPHDPDVLLANGERDIASNQYPMIGPYDSKDPDVIEYQFLLMRLAGIDGIVVDWDGRRVNPYRHEALVQLIPYLTRYGMEMIICFEEWCGYWPIGTYGSRVEEILAAQRELQWLIDEWTTQPFYAKVGGRSPVFVFRKIPEHWFSAEEWEPLAAMAEQNKVSLIFPSGDDGLDPAARGRFFWVGGFEEPLRQNTLHFGASQYQKFLQTAQHGKSKPDHILCGSVFPGFDDTRVWGWGDGPRIAPRYHGKRLIQTWEQTLENNVDLVQLITWNDWNEGTQIEPSAQEGTRNLEIVKKYSCQWNGIEDKTPVEAFRIPHFLFQARKNIARLPAGPKAREAIGLEQLRYLLIQGKYAEAFQKMNALSPVAIPV
ncbi:MAG: hypothetical protein JNM63_17910 [Spirochaetia bacterium]|nr:hypothetical protein [Spirochaetia bacterium]